MSDLVPRKDEEFDLWVNNLFTKAEAQATALGILPSAFTAPKEKLAVWSAAWAAFRAPNSGDMDRQAKNDARAVLEPASRDFVREYLINNSALSNSGKIDMGLPVHKTTHTKAADPSTTVDVWKIDSAVIRRLGIWYKDSVGKSRAKPLNVRGIRMKAALLDHYPGDTGELTNAVFNSASPCIREFAEADRGKTYYFILRWENNSAGNGTGAGPCSEIHSAVVP
jgi:hypothetical protein